jgi:Flp pilus assembly protein TadG
MRVRSLSLARLRDEEQGAVLAIVAISLIVLIGMAVLTFDLGRGVALKRNMVNAADAGALAAARECGLANGKDSATAAASELVADNNASATVTGFQINPDDAVCSGAANPDPDGKNTVTVTVSVDQEYFFAQIFGADGGTVVANATAEWTAGVTAPAPLKLDQLKVAECEDGIPNADGMIDCYFSFEPPKTKGLESDWGWLNLPDGWPIQGQDTNPKDCKSGDSHDIGGYIGGMGGMGTGGETFVPELWDPTGAGNPPTWVCSATGHKASNVDTKKPGNGSIQDWVENVQKLMAEGQLESEPVVLFPIVACDIAKTPGDPNCREWKISKGGMAYPVVRFEGFYVKQAWNGPDIKDSPEASEHCNFDPGPPDRGFCIHLQTTGLDTPPSGGGSVLVRLVD